MGRFLSFLNIPTNGLLLVAGAVWFVAGFNILHIGVGAIFHVHVAWWVLIATCAVFLLFHALVFQRLVKKHTVRIRGYEEERKAIWHFFDRKSFVVMACMMGGGIALRAWGVLPEWFVAFFYSGLGVALMVAGVSFVVAYVRGRRPA